MDPKHQKQNSDVVTAEMLGTLHQTEIDLLWLIRTKYRFGEIAIVTADGLPRDLLKTVERIRLGATKPVVHRRA